MSQTNPTNSTLIPLANVRVNVQAAERISAALKTMKALATANDEDRLLYEAAMNAVRSDFLTYVADLTDIQYVPSSGSITTLLSAATLFPPNTEIVDFGSAFNSSTSVNAIIQKLENYSIVVEQAKDTFDQAIAVLLGKM